VSDEKPPAIASLNQLAAEFRVADHSPHEPDSARPISLRRVEQAFPHVHPIAKRREDARWYIALIIVLSLAFIVIASFVSLWLRGETPVDDVVKVIGAITAPVISIVGAMTGFYFSESRNIGD
jgi:uncharacterized membrane protein (DUF485 family)